MTRTLHTYLSRDLLKVCLLALLAFTLVLTVFAVMEPMRKQGLAPQQVAALFGYTLPVMLSLTLPIAALFATTIVYGRFSQENEFLACRASGISTASLLIPAFALGGIVTVISLILSFLVSPHMVARGAIAAKANIRDIVYHKLRSDNFFDYRNFEVHADYVDADNDIIRGIVITDSRQDGQTVVYVASRAYARFGVDDKGQKYATFHVLHVARMRPGSREQPQPEEFRVTVPLPHVLKERPTWYTWAKLWRTLRNPVENQEVRRSLGEMRRLLTYDLLARRVVEAVRRGQAFTDLRDGDVQFVLRAGRAVMTRPGQVSLTGLPAAAVPDELELAGWPALGRLTADSFSRVEVLELRQGKLQKVITGNSAKIAPTVSAGLAGFRRAAIERPSVHPVVTIEVTGNVSVTLLAPGEIHRVRPQRWTTGRPKIPQDIHRTAESYELTDIYENPEEVTPTKGIHNLVHQLKTVGLDRLRRQIISELNGRTAYCLSCCLMVALGAALGVIFRGGHLVSAFALSVAPAALIIVLILMGKQMVQNPDSSYDWGLVSIWAGLGALLIANVFVHGRLMRR